MPDLVPFAVDRADITPYYEALDAALARTGPALAPYEAGTAAPVVPSSPQGAPERLALVVSTSGSTGTPKRAMLTLDALVDSAVATHARIGAGTWLLPLPPHHIAGTQVIVRSLVAGTTPTVIDGWSLEMFVKASGLVARNAPPGSPTHTSLVPTQLRDVLDAADSGSRLGAQALDAARGFRSILVGGAATDAALRERARSAGLAIITTYGSSETAGGCVYDGHPLDGVGVEILTPDDDGVGRVALTGPTLASGYLDDPARTAAAFVTLHDQGGDAGHDGQRAFLTDDLGRLTPAPDASGPLRGAHAVLSVEGRIDDVITTGGYKVSPRVVEDAVRGIAGVRDVVAVARPHERWGQTVAVAIVTTPGLQATDELLGRLVSESRKAMPPYAVPTLARVWDTLPTTGVGKPDRAFIAAQDGWHTLR